MKNDIMKKATILVIAVIFTSVTLHSQEETEFKNSVDSISYAFGLSVYNSTLQFPMELNYDQLTKAILDAKAQKALMDQSIANTYINTTFQKLKEDDLDKTKLAGTEFMQKNKNEDGVVTTQSGLQYRYIKKGEGTNATMEDQVKVHYIGTLLNGSQFDSSYDRGEPAVFGLNSIIPGWQEILTIIPVGSKVDVWIPSDLAYGDRGAGNGEIPGGATLKFQIELLEIVE